MKKSILLKISPSITPKMAKLIEELEKAGLINGSYLLYDEENENNVKKILLKYGL